MNEVVINNKTHLAIEIPEQTHLCTLTKAGREDTDDAINLGTATEVHREAETDSLTEMETRVVREEMPMLLEMVTKTFTSTESDDESFNYL